MYLSRIDVQGFRSISAASVDLERDVTVLVGDNNGGKSNVIDALTFLTDPLDGRRQRYMDSDDLFRGPGHQQVQLQATYTGTETELAPYLHASAPTLDRLVHTLRYTPAGSGQLRGEMEWIAGNGADPADPVVKSRERLRHIYLPALRDAAGELGGGAGGRVRAILESLLNGPDQLKDEADSAFTERRLLDFVGERFQDIEGHPVVRAAADRVGSRLRRLTDGAYEQANRLGFNSATVGSLARGLRSRMADAGLSPRDIAESGMGYANLLYISTVLAQLDAATQADLTLLLVEEPEAHLHPPLQSLLLDYLREAAKNSRTHVQPGRWLGHLQVIITSHAPSLASATRVAEIVVLQRRGVTPRPTASTDQATDRSAEQAGTATEPVPESEWARYESAAINVASLGLDTTAQAKLNRYLNATRSAMLFSPRVMLVEGIAEAVLLPAMADVLFPSGTVQRARFIGTVLVPIDGVDFIPYLRLLLTRSGGERIGLRVAVITDLDLQNPTRTGESRIAEIKALITATNAQDHAEVFSSQTTLEPELLDAGNTDAFWAAWKVHQPEAWLDKKAHVEAEPAGRPRATKLNELLKQAGIRKGDFSQELLNAIDTSPDPLAVPAYLRDALRWIVDEPVL